MYLAKEKNKADAEFYQWQRQAEANKLLFTPAYLELKKYESLSNSAKLYYGPNIPKMFTYGGCHENTEIFNDKSLNN